MNRSRPRRSASRSGRPEASPTREVEDDDAEVQEKPKEAGKPSAAPAPHARRSGRKRRPAPSPSQTTLLSFFPRSKEEASNGENAIGDEGSDEQDAVGGEDVSSNQSLEQETADSSTPNEDDKANEPKRLDDTDQTKETASTKLASSAGVDAMTSSETAGTHFNAPLSEGGQNGEPAQQERSTAPMKTIDAMELLAGVAAGIKYETEDSARQVDQSITPERSQTPLHKLGTDANLPTSNVPGDDHSTNGDGESRKKNSFKILLEDVSVDGPTVPRQNTNEEGVTPAASGNTTGAITAAEVTGLGELSYNRQLG